MTIHPSRARPPALPHSAGAARRPADLEPHEAAVAAALGQLVRVGTGPEVLEAVRGALGSTPVVQATPWRRGRLALAAAAAVLMALGTYLFEGAARDAGPDAIHGSTAGRGGVPARLAGARVAGSALVLEDPSLTLYHDLETFDGVSVDAGDLLALGDE